MRDPNTDLTLSDFLNMEVIRNGHSASIVFDYYKGRPILLKNFDAGLSDFEIAEQGLEYYNMLKNYLQR